MVSDTHLHSLSPVVYTVWRASAYSAAQGRLSLAGTLESACDEDDPPIALDTADSLERRGWWDYVPERRVTSDSHGTITDNQSIFSHISRVLARTAADTARPGLQQSASIRSESMRPEHSLPPPVRTVSHAALEISRNCEKSQPFLNKCRNEFPSQGFTRSRTIGRITRIRFVRAAMRDEVGIRNVVTVRHLII